MKKKTVTYEIEDTVPAMAEERKAFYNLQTYISLFSSAGVGCYGFKEENFHCIATVELLERRLKIQKYNNKCIYDSGYICGDMTEQATKYKVFNELSLWERSYNVTDLDVLVATPPCQGMSVANHKKKDELKRNSLVVESISMTKKIKPKFFIFENVRAFLNSICTDLDGNDKTIRQAINNNLAGLYNICYRVLNFKDYGCPSSRTRTIVIGVRKDLKNGDKYTRQCWDKVAPCIHTRNNIMASQNTVHPCDNMIPFIIDCCDHQLINKKQYIKPINKMVA